MSEKNKNIQVNKEEIRDIALRYIMKNHYTSVYDCWSDALQTWLNANGYEIVKRPSRGDGEASSSPAKPQD